MAIDIRASISCNLGDIVQANVSDSTVQEAGLIKTTGVCEVLGISTPAIGTAVTFTYTTASGVTRTLPRSLFVLSSFANPYRRTTEIQLGCALTYREDLREPVKWDALDDPENSDYTEEDQQIITVPIRASSVMNYCLEKLGITATQSPLTNKFSIAEFDYSAGYVQVLNDLLVSESYCGFLNGGGELEVFSLDVKGGTGPVIGIEKLIDVGGVSAGKLPGEAVTVSYSTLKLKQPDTSTSDADANAVKRWELSRTVNGPVTYTIAGQTFKGTEVTETRTTYSRINGNDVPVKRVTTRSGPSASIGGSIAAAYIKKGLGFNNVHTTLAKEVESIAYDSNGEAIRSVVTTYEQELKVFGGLSLEYVLSGTDYVAFAYELIKSGKTVNAYDNGDRFRQTVTDEYTLWPFSIPGQQSVAESRDSLLFSTSTAVAGFVNAVKSMPLTLINTQVDINIIGETPSRPKDVLNSAYADGGDPNNGWRTESSTELELALGSATAQRRIEFSMPYAPDDIFVRSGTEGNYTYTAQASDAPAKAKLYGTVQNKLLLAARSGMSVQCAGGVLPPMPYAPFSVTADGVSGLYRTNGTTWTMSGEGLIMSTDGLMMGGVGAASGSTGSAWFPTSPTISTLPTAPAVVDTSPTQVLGTVATVGANPQTTLNTAYPDAVAGDGVQDLSTDEFWTYNGSTWENVGTNPGPTMTVTSTVPVWNETVKAEGRIRLLASVQSLAYPLNVLTEIPAYGVRLGVGVARIRKVEVPAAFVDMTALTPAVGISAAVAVPTGVLNLEAQTSSVSTGVSIGAPSASVELSPASPVVSTGASVGVPAVELLLLGEAPVSAGTLGTLLSAPAAELSLSPADPAVSTGVSVGVPTAEVVLATPTPSSVGETDPYFASVSLLLHMDGANAGTSFVDSSSNGLAITANGNVVTSTAQSKFGGASALFDGTTDSLTTPTNAVFTLDGDFTIEFWCYINTLKQSGILANGASSFSGTAVVIVLDHSTHNDRFGIWNFPSLNGVLCTTPTVVTGQWYHVAFVRSGTTLTPYLNGVASTSATTSATFSFSTTNLRVGRYWGGDFAGYLDDLRITKGVARTIVVPTQAYPS